MKRIMILMVLAMLIALYLSGGALAFNSPVSPIYPTPPWWDHTPTVTRAAPQGMPTWAPPDMWPTPYWYDTGTPTPVVTSQPQVQMTTTPASLVPISPIFQSPIVTPDAVELMCVAVGHWGQVLCYEVR